MAIESRKRMKKKKKKRQKGKKGESTGKETSAIIPLAAREHSVGLLYKGRGLARKVRAIQKLAKKKKESST
jgi:hypothetical protein